MCGRDLWNLILDEVPTKPGLQLVVSHTSRLALNESLKQQGLGGHRAQVSATYIPVNLLAAVCFALGDSVEDEEFSLNGITEMTLVDGATIALMHNLPKSLQSLTFGHKFDKGLHDVRLPAGLQSLAFGDEFNQSLDNVTWPASLQSLTFEGSFNQNVDNVTWPAGLQNLTFGQNFDQSLDRVAWPAGLQSLRFEGNFNQSLDNVTWPAGLDNVVWPEDLQSLSFLNIEFPPEDLDFRTAGWPRALRKLVFGDLAFMC